VCGNEWCDEKDPQEEHLSLGATGDEVSSEVRVRVKGGRPRVEDAKSSSQEKG
jgi:hypothetical protein